MIENVQTYQFTAYVLCKVKWDAVLLIRLSLVRAQQAEPSRRASREIVGPFLFRHQDRYRQVDPESAARHT